MKYEINRVSSWFRILYLYSVTLYRVSGWFRISNPPQTYNSNYNNNARYLVFVIASKIC